MKLYLKRDKTDENSRYIVFDENGDEKYRIVGKRSTSTERIYIMFGDTCVAKIKDTHLGPMRSCSVTTQDGSFHIVITCSKDKIAITYHRAQFHIRGDVLNKSYDILDVANSVVACISRRFKTSSETLELNIYMQKYEILCISSALCLNNICMNDTLALQAT
ncbi:MAG: hypothetical protein E7513_01845 [Ruminococcaceae bacterium]|nr:hypothetical protein [Oscillospiraceae bacterium]